MIKSQLVSMVARVPVDLKKKVMEHCERNGIKLQFFVAEALEQSLGDVLQDVYEAELMNQRLKSLELTTLKDFKKYVDQRKAKK